MPKWEAIMLYCTKCKSICEDSNVTVPSHTILPSETFGWIGFLTV